MLRNTLGQITFNQLVYALIAIIVLVIVIMIFSGNFGIQNERLQSCTINGGTCKIPGECTGDSVVREGEFRDCKKLTEENPGKTYVCCAGFF